MLSSSQPPWSAASFPIIDGITFHAMFKTQPFCVSWRSPLKYFNSANGGNLHTFGLPFDGLEARRGLEHYILSSSLMLYGTIT
jgi:hypothetical protein